MQVALFKWDTKESLDKGKYICYILNNNKGKSNTHYLV